MSDLENKALALEVYIKRSLDRIHDFIGTLEMETRTGEFGGSKLKTLKKLQKEEENLSSFLEACNSHRTEGKRTIDVEGVEDESNSV